jgi:hypothetical protein
MIVKMIVEKQMECRLAGETEVLGENLPQLHSIYLAEKSRVLTNMVLRRRCYCLEGES